MSALFFVAEVWANESPNFFSHDGGYVFECKECGYRVEPDYPLVDGHCPACAEDDDAITGDSING